MSRRLLLLLLSPSGAWATPPATVNIGGLFPMFKTSAASYAKDASGIDRFSAFKLAIDEINDKTDGVADTLLPNTQLRFAYRDSKRDDGSAFSGALELTRDTFGGAGVSAIVGAASSGPSMSAALVTAKMTVPQISYSSTSSLLSDGKTYSYFLRTPPSDAFQGVGIADLIKNLFGYTRVATVSSTDGYGSAGIAAFHTAADEVGEAGMLKQLPLSLGWCPAVPGRDDGLPHVKPWFSFIPTVRLDRAHGADLRKRRERLHGAV